jgi:hypothetical protein
VLRPCRWDQGGSQDALAYGIAGLGASGYFAYRAWAAASRKVGIEKDDDDR